MASRHNKKGRSKGTPAFVMVPKHLLTSAAYQSLSCTERSVLFEAFRLYNGSNNGWLAMAVSVIGPRIGKTKSTASRALRALDDAGFLKPMFFGRFTRGKPGAKRMASEWRLTCFHCDRGHDRATNDFMEFGKAEPDRTERYDPIATVPSMGPVR